MAENTGVVLPEVDQPSSYYMRRVMERAFAQGLHEPYGELADALQNPRQSIARMTEAIDSMSRLRQQFMTADSSVETQDSLIDAMQHDYNEAARLYGSLRGLPTGWSELDYVLGGYQPQDLIVWVARPGRGKSWFLLKQFHAAWQAGYKPLYISNEMGGLQNMRRLYGVETGVNPTFIREGRLGTLARRRFDQRLQEMRDRPPLLMATANFERTVDSVANFIDEHTPDIVYIDAGYLLKPRKVRYGSGGRRETVSDVIEELKELANNAGIPFVITVQFNRTAEQRRRGSSRGSTGSPIAHLGLDVIGETDVIAQAASHVLGMELPPPMLNQQAYRVFGFLKGREGEDGWWLANYMATKTAPIDLGIVERPNPLYEQIARGMSPAGRPEQTPPHQRSQLMRINGQ